MRKKWILYVSVLLLSFGFVNGCGSKEEYPSAYKETPSPTLAQLKKPMVTGEKTMQDEQGIVSVDYSHVEQGYICATLTKDPGRKVAIWITKEDEGNLPYDLTVVGKQEIFPFELGSGQYLIRILLNDAGDEYYLIHSEYIDVKLENEQIAFLYPNQIVDYNADSETIKKAFALTKNDHTDLERITSLYNFVVDTIVYDDDKAKEVDDVYVLPIIDETLKTKKGICFDYAALLTAMLRSQQIPTRLVTGNTSIEYHAWVEVYLPDKGWISAEILLNSKKWSRMDPTFAASDANYEDGYEDKYYY